ncbi:hypothetical protein BDZ45DRAFT_596275 [Acephala macrosclerotiorum]|nr:hypothetical protein BDZ45DRAFT_596275 [Acephala macrosclerotiorum]
MTEVLEEACKKLGYNPSNYTLKYKEKPLDLSLTYRQTGLVSGAKLELVQASRTPSVVSVALQLPDGGRLTDKVPSDTTLWLILRKFESSGGLTGMANYNFTARGTAQMENGASGSGRIFYEMPTVNIMSRELSTFADLQKTLAQLGVNGGRAMIRLNFKKTEQPLEEAMAEIGKYFKEEEAPAEAAPAAKVETITETLHKLESNSEGESKDVDMTSGTSETTTSVADPSPYPDTVGDLPPPITPSKRAAEETPSPEQPQVLGPDQRPISVYRPPSGQVPLAALRPHNESDYEPTIVHAKMHQERLKDNGQNKRLPSDAEAERLEKERAAKLASVKNVSIKVRFPDVSSIVAPFTTSDTGADLYTFVRGVIVAEDQPFKLVYNGDKGSQTVPNNEKKLIKDLGFKQMVLVNFLWGDDARESVTKATTLKPQYAQNAKDVAVPDVPSVDAGEEDQTPAVKAEKPKGGSGDGKKKGIPSWFKGLAKK